MKVSFVGGKDVQKSLNHSDNKCVNLVPALNDSGDIAAFYKVDGLKSEGTFSGVPTGAYKASNGRAFYTSGTVLYELTVPGGVYTSTNRGTITSATNYRFSDNGIEMILVNGTDGWIFTFATNTLLKIKVATSTFTVTIANPAVFTKVAHGLVAGDAIRLTSTTGSILSDTILSGLSPSTVSVTGYIPYDVKVAPSGNFVYAVSRSSSVYPSFYVHGFTKSNDGSITPLSPPTTDIKGTAPLIGDGYLSSLAISSDGISGYATSNTGGSVKMFGINTSTGAVTLSTPNSIATGTYPTHVAISPDDKSVYVVNSGSNTVSQYSRNLGTGDLTALTPATVATGTTPQEIVISDDGLFAYVTNKGGNTISLFSRVVLTGLLTPVSAVSCEGLSPTGISLSPDTNNPFLYVVNNGSSEVEVFSRNSGTGVITHVTSSSIATGSNPKKIIISAESAYVTNATDNTVSMYIRDTSTGLLTVATGTAIATGTSPFGIAITPTGDSVYVANTGSSNLSQYSRNGTDTLVGLPTGLSELTTYYVIAAGLTADAFEVSETSGGTAVSTSGQQAGVHTYTTLGYGFPEGCKTVSYMNGRFVAVEPNTQNFYVSEVLNGKWWDALNVQTVDSNPDYVVGEIVSHNELIVFCEDSGEVFYDSGTTPAPFVRNPSGIFEVGCVAEYSIVNLDNQVFWLGGNKTGAGIVYRMQGLTPVRISTHSIEYAIQSMTTISDAKAFAYQKDGHHYYVLTFPTGNKTFVYDVNTGLWHERAKTTPDAIIPVMTWTPSTTNLPIGITDVAWNGTVYCAISVFTTNLCYTSTDGVTWTSRTLPANIPWASIAWNGTVFCAIGRSGTTIAATSTDGITWTLRTLSSAASWTSLIWVGGSINLFVATGYDIAGGTGKITTSPDGISWTGRTIPAATTSTISTLVTNNSIITCIFASSTTTWKSTDGINWSTGSITSANWQQAAYGNGIFVVIVGFSGSTNVYATSTDGITWTNRTLPATAAWKYITFNGTAFCVVNSTNNNTYISLDGLSWTLVSVSGTTAEFNTIGNNGSTFVAIGNTATNITAVSSSITIPATTYTSTEWPVNEYMYYNDKHIVSDSTTTILSIDSATYKNSSEAMQYIRSFNVPTQNMNRTRHTRLQLDCEAGVAAAAANITLKWSDDGAHTFNTGLTASLGTTGEYSKRVVWHRLGMTKGQQRVYELSGASDSKVVLLNVHLD